MVAVMGASLAAAAGLASGGVFVSGTTTGDLDGNKLVGLWDVFVTKYTASGDIAHGP